MTMTNGDTNGDGKIHVVLLDEFDDGLAVSIGRCLLIDRGFSVHTISADPNSSLKLSRRTTSSYAPLDTPEAVVDAVRLHAASHRIDVVLPVQETMIVLVGRAVAELTEIAAIAPHPDPALCARVDHKGSFHMLAEAAGLPMPRAWPASALTSQSSHLRAHDGPLLVKPCMGWGGGGILRFESGQELFDADARGEVPSAGESDWIIEEFLEGIDASASLLAVDGVVVAVSNKRTAIRQTKSFKSAGLMNEYFDDPTIAKIATTFASTLGWSGPAHLDFRLTPDGSAHLLEVNPRFWQTTLGTLKVGVNYPAMACRLALGLPVSHDQSPSGYSINLPILVGNWSYLGTLARNPVRAVRAFNLHAVMADPFYEAAQFGIQTKRQIKRKLASVARRLARVSRR